MAVQTILPMVNLKAEDIRDTLNANGGSVTNDILTFFSTNAKINKWSLNKPEDYKKDFDLTEAERIENHYSLNMDSYQYLIGDPKVIIVKDGRIDISNDTTGFLYKLCKGTLGQFDYKLPKGGANSPYRLGDFRGYDPKAPSPIPVVEGGMYKYTNAGAVDIRLNVPEQKPKNITLDKLMFDYQTPLEGMYYGVVLYNSDLTDVIFVTQTQEQKDKGLAQVALKDTENALITSKKGKYKAKVFFSNKIVGVNEYSVQPDILLADDDVYAEVVLMNINLPDLELIPSAKQIGTEVKLSVEVINNLVDPIVVQFCTFLQSGSFEEEYAQNSLPLEIPGLSSSNLFVTTLPEGNSFTATLVIDGKTHTVTSDTYQISE